MQRLRKQMKAAGASVQVAKNRLAQIALKGTDVASISPLLKGPTLIAYSADPVAAPKVAAAFAGAADAVAQRVPGEPPRRRTQDGERRARQRLRRTRTHR